MKSGLKIALIILASIVVTVLVITVLAGPIVKWYVEKHSVELFHREATVEQVWIDVFSGSVWIKNFQVKEENRQEQFLKFNKLYVRLAWPKMLVKKVQVNRVALDGFEAHIVQNGIRFNFSDIIDFFVQNSKDDKETDSEPWAVDLRQISVINSKVLYDDILLGSHFDTRNINIDVPHLLLSGGVSQANISMEFANQGKMALQGGYDIQKGDLDAKLQLSNFQIADIQPYIESFMNVGKISGVANGTLKAKGSVKHIMQMVASGTLSVRNAVVTNIDQTPLGSFSDFSVQIAKADLGKMDFQLDDVSLKDLVFYFDLMPEGTTFSKIFKEETSSDLAENDTISASVSTNSSPNIHYLVRNLNVSNATLYYADHSISPKQQHYQISNLNISAKDLETDKQAPISLSAQLGNSGKLRCKASADPLDLTNASVDLSIENLDIKDFTPYSLYFLAYPIEDGLLSFNSNITISHNWLDSQNGLDIYKPKFGDKVKTITPKAAKIPMKAAMYIITDRKGHVKMDLPIKGDISSPEFSFSKIIWKTFVNLIVKVAASPIDFLAKVGRDQTFSSMQIPEENLTTLTIEQVHQLGEMAQVLKDNQEMTLKVKVGCVGVDSEIEAECEKANVLRQSAYKTISNYLFSNGIEHGRIVFDKENPPQSSSGILNVKFDLLFPE